MKNWQKEIIQEAGQIIKQVNSQVSKEMKWKKQSNPEGVPVWSYKGIICTGETYKNKVKFTFFKGSTLADATKLFNSGTGVRRAIDIYENDIFDEKSFKELINAAIQLNESTVRK